MSTGASTTDADGQDGLAWALRYVAHGLRIFPVNAAKKPLTKHGFKDATTDPAVIEGWWTKWPAADPALAVRADMVVVDIDVKHGKHGYDDFKRLAGCDPSDVLTPQSTTPSGGRQLFYRASVNYKNAVAIGGTGIDTRSEGGYVVLPGDGNGRQWLRELIGAALLPAPAWLDSALRQVRAPLVLAPRAALAPSSSDPWAQRKARSELEKACARIVAAPWGAQDSTRHAQCFYIGGIIARGDLGYAEANAALYEAACAMPVYRDPWRNLEERVARSIGAGMERPLAVSETELWMRSFRARMRLKRPMASAGARNG
jgi:Bifunctional DNA primase/polymerase, N-terminal